MSLSGMAVALKASTSSAAQQQRWHRTRDHCQYGFTSVSERKCRKRPLVLCVRAISGKLDLDFSDPSWKQKYQEDWDRRFSLPHITDIYDMEPRTTTFSLKKNRTPLGDGDGDVSSTDMRNGYVNKDDRALLKVIKYASPNSAGAECIDPDCSWVEHWVHRAGPRKEIYYEPEEVKAAIVTCGGLCPGLNDVIRQIVFTLETYGVKNIVGIPFGYRGFF
ncbi:unnamed protein product [Urochloa humidicola]